ncbi:MAG: hypothetical protein HLUCCA01_12950 [Bacteroidetes bacterium HLUCCA01]|nr:MAG: hypothetical protein HLUCCA01_12950 [Bacteroidetes bacterium HLUCCA01]
MVAAAKPLRRRCVSPPALPVMAAWRVHSILLPDPHAIW